MKKPPKKSVKKKPAAKKRGPRQDDEDNAALISMKMFEMITKNPRMPTNKKISEATGLCIKTIERHRKKPGFKKMLAKARSMNDMMMVQYMNRVSKSSDATMWKNWWILTEPQAAEAFNNKKVDVTTKGQAIKQVSVTVLDTETKKAVDEL